MSRETLVEQAAAAFRARTPTGEIQSEPAWHDLDADGRREAFAAAYQLRQLEMALDPEGLSSTARALLAAINAPRP